MSEKLSKPWLVLCFVIASIPAILLGRAILINTVDLIFGDEWGVVWFYNYKFLQGNLTLNDLIQQHNESRLLFPKIIFFGLAALNHFHYSTYNESILIFATACLISINIFLLSRFTLLLAPWKYLLLLTLANLLIFSPIQWQNWNWGIQLIVFMPIACISTALVLTKLKLRFWIIAVTTALLGTISTFSYANGMLFWVTVFPGLAFTQISDWKQLRQSLSSRWKVLALWLVFAVLNIGFYFYQYKKPPYHPSFFEAFKKPVDAVLYLLTFLGSPVAAGSLLAAQIMGAVVLSYFVWLIIRLWQHRHHQGWLQRVYPWLCLAAYTLLSAVITTGGRVGFGVIQALDSRYTTFSAYLWVAVLYLAAVSWHESQLGEGQKASQSTRWFRVISSLVLFVMLLMQSFSWSHGQRKMEQQYRNRLYGKACMLTQEIIVQVDCMKNYVFPPFEINGLVSNVSRELNQRNAIRPNLMTSQAFQTAAQTEGSASYGYIETLSPTTLDNSIKVVGWAVLSEHKQPAHGVLLAALTRNGVAVPLAVAPVKGKRPDVTQLIGPSRYRNRRLGWKATLPTVAIPSDATEVIALAIDVHSGQLHRLQGSHQIQQKPS